MVCVRVLGSIDAVDGPTEFAVGGPSLRHLLAVLVAAGSRGASSLAIAESLWGDGSRPVDPSGAIRVYVRRLRNVLGDGAIVTIEGGYRFGDVESDAASFEALVAAARAELNPDAALGRWGDAVRLWRGDAFAGSEDLPFVEPVARRLEELRLEATEAWIDARLAAGETRELVADVEAAIRAEPLREGFRAQYMTALVSAGRLPAALTAFQDFRAELAEIGLEPSKRLVELDARIARGETIDTSPVNSWVRSSVQLETLHACSSHWLRGDIDDAVDALMAGADNFDPDVVRRLRRCLTTAPPGEPIARQLWVFMIQEWKPLPSISARTLASYDARSLELTGPAGLKIADTEVQRATIQADLVRALRVRFMVGLGSPIDEVQLDTVRRLADINDADAVVESIRFDAILKIKQGQMAEAVECLRRYAAAVAEYWPTSGDDFAAMALHILATHPDSEELDIPPSVASFPVFTADVMAARVAQAWHETPGPADGLTVPYGFFQVLDTTSSDCAIALQLRWYLRTDQLEKAAVYADELRERLSSMHRDRWFQAVPAALGEYAVRTSDRGLADVITEIVEPWRGEILGLWPCDAIIGPADQLLDQLASVRHV